MERVTDMEKILEIVKEFFEKGKWEYLCAQPLQGIVSSLTKPYVIPFLKKIIPVTSADDFAVALRAAWCMDSNGLDSWIGDDFTKEDIFELLNACNPQKLMTDEECENKEFLRKLSFLEVYRSDAAESEPNQMFSWAVEPRYVVDNLDGVYGEYKCYGCYEAMINLEDVYACIGKNGVILNPDKLYGIHYFNSIVEICNEDDLPDKDEGEDED